MNLPENQKNVLVIGAGFGGLSCVKTLHRLFCRHPEICKDYRIMLIDQHDYQLFTPSLYEVATTPENIANELELKTIVTFPLEKALAGSKIVFVQGKASIIDYKEKKVALENGSIISFEYLVVAVGSEPNFFGITGLEKRTYTLKTLYDALHIRNAVTLLFQSQPSTLSLVVAGAGTTGVELAGELSRWLRRLGPETGRNCTITLLQREPSVLPEFDSRVIKKVVRRLSKLGVKIKVNAALQEVRDNLAILSSGEIVPFDFLIWTGGVKAAELLRSLPQKIEPRGRAEVSEELLCIPTDPHLDLGGKFFTLGDAACFYDPKTLKPVPGVARAAIDQGKIVAHNILADLQHVPRRVYRAKNYPYVLPIGGKWAIARFGPLVISGFFGWLFKGLIDLYYAASILPLTMAIKIWVKGIVIFIRND